MPRFPNRFSQETDSWTSRGEPYVGETFSTASYSGLNKSVAASVSEWMSFHSLTSGSLPWMRSEIERGGRRGTRVSGFSLIEVIFAVVIFAVGMVGVLALFAPVTKSVSTVSDAEAAARAADAVRARLQALPFSQALALVQEVADVRKKDGDGTYDPNNGTKYPAVIFGKLSGDIGIYDPANGRKAWYDSSVPTSQRVENGDKFFEIDLIRNDALTPKAQDATAAMVAFTIRIRWPMFMPAASGNPVQVGANPGGGGPVPFDHSKKQVLFFSGSILR